MRAKFKKNQQRKFIQQVLKNIGCPSLRSLLERGFNINYQTLKSYYNENRTLPESLVDDFCYIGKVDKAGLNADFLNDNWGQIKGGRK